MKTENKKPRQQRVPSMHKLAAAAAPQIVTEIPALKKPGRKPGRKPREPKIPALIIEEELIIDEEGDDYEEEEEGGGGEMSRQLKKYIVNYVKTKNAAGDSTLVCGDELSSMLLPLNVKQVMLLAVAVVGAETVKKYAGLNPGQRRMNCGNRIRHAVKSGAITLEEVSELIAQLKISDLY